MSVYARNMSVYTLIVKTFPMPSQNLAPLPQCNCLALRQAARHVTQFYDQYLAPTGLRSTQFSILAKLHGLGPMTINALARELVMDRTTLEDPSVNAALNNYVKVKFQAEDPDQPNVAAVMKHFNAAGLPTYARNRIRTVAEALAQ